MKLNALSVLCVSVAALLLGSAATSESPETSASAGPCVCHKIVRADYIQASSGANSNTFVDVLNTSHTSPITMLNVYVVGAFGVNNLLATYTGLNGQVVPPLGRVRFSINNSTMPSLSPAFGPGNVGVANVVVGWSGGSLDSVRVTSNVIRFSPGNDKDRTELRYEGYAIQL